MIISVFDTQQKNMGTLQVEAGSEPKFQGDFNSSFAELLKKILAEGVYGLQDLGRPGQESVIARIPVALSDTAFPLALKQHLMGQGYRVVELHPEVEEKIRKLLQEFPETDDKKEILEQLPNMSYLEQTFTLQQLQQFATE